MIPCEEYSEAVKSYLRDLSPDHNECGHLMRVSGYKKRFRVL